MFIKEFAEKFIKAEYDAFKNGNFDALEALEGPNVVYHIGPLPDIKGFEEHKKDILMWREAVPDHQIEISYLIGEGDLCVFTLNEKGTVGKDIPGMPFPVGTKYRFDDAVGIVHLKNGKTKEVWIKGTPIIE